MAPPGILFVVSGPSGAGKGTLVNQLVARVPGISRSISATTRSPRPGEIEGQDYYFQRPEEFEARVDKSEFLEWAQVHGNRYGTLTSEVERLLAAGADVILEIDVQGAFQVREKTPDAVLIFVVAPEMADLRKRLQRRQTENEREFEERLRRAEEELKLKGEYKYVVVNDRIEAAVAELAKIVDRERRERRPD